MNGLVKLLVFVLIIDLYLFYLGLVQTKAQDPVSLGAGQGVQQIDQVQVLRMPPVDVRNLRREDNQRAAQGQPPRFAQPLPVNVSPTTHGRWEQLDSETRRWRLRIISAGALSLNLGFGRYVMPSGGRLLVYTPDYSQVIGPFTEQDNESHGQLWTPLLRGDEIVIEITLPTTWASPLELVLTSVNHGYTKFGQSQVDKSGSCNIDVICPAAADWRDEIRSVAAYSLGGSIVCSGALVNNTAQDLKPYFLTASHCEDEGDDIFDPGDAASMVVYWNYETSMCNGTPDGTLTQFNTGAILRASYLPTDFALVELDDPIPSTFNVHWAGWDNTGANPISATTIHHPGGDEKRISFEHDLVTITSYLNTVIPGDGTHLRVTDWDLGTTELGSSGAPLFDQAHRVVGQLHGGLAACGNDFSDWYGRLSVSWAGGGTPSTRLQNWLDPPNTGTAVLDGRDRAPDFTLSVTPNSQNVCTPNDAIYDVTLGSKLGFSDPVNLNVGGNPAGTSINFSNSPVTPPGSSLLTITHTAGITGSYHMTITGVTPTSTHTSTVTLNLIDLPGVVKLTSPANGATSQSLIPQFEWEAAHQGTTYDLEVASDSFFAPVVYSATVTSTSHLVTTPLLGNGTYYWRVKPQNLCGPGSASPIYSFTTTSPICRTPSLAIPDNDLTGVVDTMVVSNNGVINDLNVSISATHTFVGDLIFTLEHVESGTHVTLIDRPGNFCRQDDIEVILDDEAGSLVEDECMVSLPAISGIFRPNNPLYAFDGQELSGSWRLAISDHALANTGTLVEWCLQAAGGFPHSDTVVYLPSILKN